jgi:16S rRNA (guanine1207-N2)-methyltransferase
VVGILAAKLIGPDHVVMTDISEAAVTIAKSNARLNQVESVEIVQSDGFRDLTQKDFSMILSNPPYHEDFSVPKHFIEKGFNRLVIGGRLYMVTKRKDWYRNKLISIFGGVRVWEIDDYFIFMSIKKDASYAGSKTKKK